MNKKIAVLTLVFVLSMPSFSFLLLTEHLQTASAQELIPVNIPNVCHMIVESIADPSSVDPAWASDTPSGELIFNVYEPLIQFDFESVEIFVPQLATEWAISPDDLTYTFKIREGVQFHDGTIMTTEDVEYSFEHILVQDRSGGPAWMFYEPLFSRYHADMAWPEDETCPINLAVERNDTHVWFNLNQTYPPFMQILCGTWGSILNKEFCIAHDDWPGTWDNWKDYHDPPTAPLDLAGYAMCGTGPYKKHYWTPGVEWSIYKFDDYWGGWPAPHSSSYVWRATVKVVYDWGIRLADFRAGTADMVYVPRAYIAQVEGWPGIRGIKDLPTLSVDAAFFNFNITTPSPYIGSGALDGNGIPPDFFSDIHVRKAFAYAFNHTRYIAEVWLNEAQTPPTPHIRGLAYSSAVWDGSMNPTYGWLEPVPIRDINLTKVEEELKLAYGGSPGSPGPVWTNGFKMTITYPLGNVVRMTAASMLKEILHAVNDKFDITTTAVTYPTYVSELWYYPTFRSIMPIYIWGSSADYPDPHNLVMPFQHSEGDLAYPSSYHNATVDAWIEAGIAESDPVEREYIYWQIAWSYYYDVPGVCLDQPLGRHWERDWVQGWYYNPVHPGYYFYHLWKGLDADIDGDGTVDEQDEDLILAHWSNPPGPLGYDRIADIWPELQYRGDLPPEAWLPQDEYGVPLPSIGEVDTYDLLLVNAQWNYTVATVHDVAVTSVTPSQTVVYLPRDTVIYIYVEVHNQGNFTESFNVTAYYDSTPIGTQEVTNLNPCTNMTLTFPWNTAGLPEGNYTIKAVADVVPGETYTENNTYIDGVVTVVKPTVSVYPESIIGPPPRIGDTFTVNITVSIVEDLYTWQAGLTFNPNVLECLSIEEGEFLKRAGVTTLWTPGSIDNTIGEISYSACSLTGATPGVSGTGQLMNVTFRVKNSGTSILHLTDVLLLDSNLVSITPLNTADGYVEINVQDVAILSVETSATEAYPTWTAPLNITVVVENQGTATENFNVTTYANFAEIETKTVTLAAGANTTLVFNWNVTGVAEGTYTIRAEAEVLYGETDTADNTVTDGTVKLKHPGDANDDGVVNAYDLGLLGKAMGTSVGEPLYDPRVDFNGDGTIDNLDHEILKDHWP